MKPSSEGGAMHLQLYCKMTNKVGYRYYSAALKRLKEVSKKDSFDYLKGYYPHVYRCPFCHLFHYGNLETTFSSKELKRRRRRLDNSDDE